MTKIAVLVGSLQADSLNKKLSKTIEEMAPEGVEFIHLDISEVPVFNEDNESAVPASVVNMKAQIAAADGVLFITPEYNRSMPGVMKNAVDWASRPYGDNSFDGKPAAVTGATGSPWGTVAAQGQLKATLLYLNTHLMGQPELYVGQFNQVHDDQGVITEHMSERINNFIDTFVTHIDLFKK